jgi:predicted metal-dependent hydrolase
LTDAAAALGLDEEGQEAFARGVQLFNERRFYEAHDVLEEAWRPLRGPGRSFLQGLIQVAVAFHHLEQGNLAGARSVLQRAEGRLAPYAPAAFGLDVAAHLRELHDWQERIEAGTAAGGEPPLWSFKETA